MDAVDLGLVLGGPAGRGWGFGAFIVVYHCCALLVRRGSLSALGVCEITVLSFRAGVGFVVVGEEVFVVFGYARLNLFVGPLLSCSALGGLICLREVFGFGGYQNVMRWSFSWVVLGGGKGNDNPDLISVAAQSFAHVL